MPDPSPSNADSLNSNFLQLGRRRGGRPQQTLYPRRLPVSCNTHYVSRHRTHNLTTATSRATGLPYPLGQLRNALPVCLKNNAPSLSNCSHQPNIAILLVLLAQRARSI